MALCFCIMTFRGPSEAGARAAQHPQLLCGGDYLSTCSVMGVVQRAMVWEGGTLGVAGGAHHVGKNFELGANHLPW